MRKGFTLIEMLIVIVVIGILSSMMMLSSTESVSSAKAADIITSLNNIKIAALAHYIDSFDVYNTTANPDEGKMIACTKLYLQNADAINMQEFSNSGGDFYSITTDSTNKKIWFVAYKFSSTGNTEQIRSKLAGRAHSAGLKSAASSTARDFQESDTTVYMRIR
ncbi:MAG: type II secretion system protein [Synergistaceae bacterium]|nr:type II secretion system protein [Synergistaceae bacterium]